jgi:hypothetical protein
LLCFKISDILLKSSVRLHFKCDGSRAETRFRLSAKLTSPFKSARASVHSTTDSRGVRISGTNAGYTMSGGSVKSTGYPLHSPVSPSLPLSCAITFQLDSTTATTDFRCVKFRHFRHYTDDLTLSGNAYNSNIPSSAYKQSVFPYVLLLRHRRRQGKMCCLNVFR